VIFHSYVSLPEVSLAGYILQVADNDFVS
jgi:hypothetical protein